MFELARPEHWFQASRGLPKLAYGGGMSVLKAIGYAHVIQTIRTHRPSAILEFGHGRTSPVFEMFGANAETWGIDEHSGLGTEFATADDYEAFRRKHPSTRFLIGLLGTSSQDLPERHFDLVCSVSVVEHIPNADLPRVLRDIYRILRPGGLVVNSFDLPYGYDTWAFFSAHVDAGFEWLDPATKPHLRWDAATVAFEDPRVVMDYYMAHVGEGERPWPGNFGTCLSAARKPV